VLPWGFSGLSGRLGVFGLGRWPGFLFATGVAHLAPGLPLDWYGQFRLEQRVRVQHDNHGFGGWTGSKGCLLGLALGYPLLALLLKLGR